MEPHLSDSKKVFKVFDAKLKRRGKKREDIDDTNSVATDGSNSGCQLNTGHMSGKPSLQELHTADNGDGHQKSDVAERERGSSPSVRRSERSPRRHRRPMRDGLSLALKAGMVSTPRSASPPQEGEEGVEAPTTDQDFVYAFLEEAIKQDKKKYRHGRRHDDHRSSRDTEGGESRERHHRHRRRRDGDAPSRDKHRKEESPTPAIDQTVLLETFAKLCAQMNENNPVQRTQSHKSLQCEVVSRRDLCSDRHPERISYHDNDTPTRIRSQGNFRLTPSQEKIESRQKCSCYCDKEQKYDKKLDYPKESKFLTRIDYDSKYASKIDVNRSRDSRGLSARMQEDERFRDFPHAVATRTCIDHYRDRPRDRDYRDYDRRNYEDDRRRFIEQKTSRSFDVHRDGYEDERCRRTSRSDTKDQRYDDKYYEKHEVKRHSKERRSRRPSERFDRSSVVSRDDDRERDRFSERERDSGLSVADCDTSTLSGRTGKSNYLKVVKQEITEQREAMDKMMKLWKELMRCFKGISQTQNNKDKIFNESACENVRESAAAQLRLWRECMRRYETVARDVGDTDARLMEEINKQRSEMSEMATMWQECLQRYRDMSNDFNTLKQQLATAESPTRMCATPVPALASAEGEGAAPAPPYRLPLNYPHPQMPPPNAAYPCASSPLRGRASAPPAWWWGGQSPRRRSPRHSSPDSRDGRETDRERRHKNKDSRDASRYKEKPKPTAARSEHRRRKR